MKSVTLSSTTGHGTNVIQGLAVSLEATAIPALIIVSGILLTNYIAGLFIAIAVTTISFSWNGSCFRCYGLATDNAGGIAEMSKLPNNVRKTTDADAVGSTTKAVTAYTLLTCRFRSSCTICSIYRGYGISPKLLDQT